MISLDDRIEAVEAKLEPLIRKAETSEDWAEICRIESEDLFPLLNLKINERVRKLHERALS